MSVKTPIQILQEILMKRGCAPPSYIESPAVNGAFECYVEVFSTKYLGKGISKKMAKQNAAELAIEGLKKQNINCCISIELPALITQKRKSSDFREKPEDDSVEKVNDDNPDKWFASFIQNIEKLTGDCISAKNLIKNGTNVPLEFIVLINAKINVLKGASENLIKCTKITPE